MAASTKSQLPQKLYPKSHVDELPDNERKKEKVGGKTFTLQSLWFVPGKLAPLKAGSVFKECVDGFYSVYNELGNRMWFRVGAAIIKEVFK